MLLSRFSHSITSDWTYFPSDFTLTKNFSRFQGAAEAKHSSSLTWSSDCMHQVETVRNELYGRFNHCIEGLGLFWGVFGIATSLFSLDFTLISKYLSRFQGLREQKLVESDVIEWLNWLKGARNGLYGRFNPYAQGLGLFWHVFCIVTSLFCLHFTLIYISIHFPVLREQK